MYVHMHTWQVEIEHSYSLSTVEKLNYDDVINPASFHLVFPNFTIILQADTQEEIKDWVEKIRTGGYHYGMYGDDLQTSL